ncbi:MAG: hypothetical protein FJX80_13170, partial [Bacteroidetes bacterium]|nr:hypothetical protein [Bacteroidota bacterium]
MKLRILLVAAFLNFYVMGHSQCQVVYVTTNGNSSALGTIDDPLDVQTALLNATEGAYIRMATGTYTVNNSLVLTTSQLTIEGGFIDSLG